MSTTFAQLGVPESICDALAKRGITEPFEIQSATLNDTMSGRDVCGRAPTGSGKTLAFGIPLVANVEQAQPKRPRALVLAPTRELAEQITEEIRTFSGSIKIHSVYGGVGYEGQIRALRRGVEILVACPGRLEDLISSNHVDLSQVDRVVLDEADRMADMGFMPAVRRILDQTSPKRQTVLFSATLDGDIAKLTRDYQTNPVRHEVGDETPDITSAFHAFWKVDKADRAGVTSHAVNAVWPAIIFCRTRHGSDRLAKQLGRTGVKAETIHGGRSQRQRARALNDFAKGRVQALVATDVAARGIHVDGVAMVVHYDPPEDHKAYVHRSGRTARAGESGIVLSLIQSDQVKDTKRMQRRVGLDVAFTEPDSAGLREVALKPNPELNQSVEPEYVSESRRPQRSRSASRPRTRATGGKSRGRGDQRRSSSDSRNARPASRNGSKSRDGASKSRDGASKSRNGAPKSRKPTGKASSKSRAGGKGRHAAQQSSKGNNGGPNRKARRAHLQPGAAQRRSA